MKTWLAIITIWAVFMSIMHLVNWQAQIRINEAQIKFNDKVMKLTK